MSSTLIDNLENMLAQGQDNAMLRFGLGKAYYEYKDYNTACDHLNQAVQFKPEYTAAWKLLGFCQQQLGYLQQALQTYEQGIEAAQTEGDKQAEKEMQVFVKKINKKLNKDQ